MKNNLTNQERQSIYRRDGWRCALCDGTAHIQIHHYIHRGQGGTNHPHNLICLCDVCHGFAHGIAVRDYPDVNQETIEQAIVEYLADYYTDDETLWNPYNK